MSNNKRLIDPAIVAAVIGVMGTLCVTLITLFANRALPNSTPVAPPSAALPTELQPSPQPTWTISPTSTLTETVVPTDTVPAGDPTSTAEPPTPTTGPTFTPAPPAIGSDWANGCISVLWQPYPSTVPTLANNGCLSEPVNIFFALDGRLTFLISNGRFGETQVYGLFAPLPANGSVSVSAFVRQLQRGQVWAGVFAQPDIESQGMVMAIAAGEDREREREVIQLTMPGAVEVKRSEPFPQDPPLYTMVFEFGNNEVRVRNLGNTEFAAFPVEAAQQWLFVGYQVQGDERVNIDAEFLNLVVQGQ